MKLKQDGILYSVITLAVISSFVALLLAFINMITEPVIAKNEAENKKNAIMKLFPECEEFEAKLVENNENVSEIYIVKSGEKISYCVLANPNGFGGAINMFIGYDSDLSITGIEIISISETPGVGTKVNDQAFLSQFISQKGGQTVELDAITGATISSKAVASGIDAASSALIEYIKEASANE